MKKEVSSQTGLPKEVVPNGEHQEQLTSDCFDERLFKDAQLVKQRLRLLEEAENYRALFNGMGEGFALCEMIWDEAGNPYDWRYLEVNPAWEHQTGLPGDGVVGRTVREVIPGVESYWIENYGKVVRDGKPVRLENQVADLKKWMEVFVYKHSENKFAAVFRDVTMLKRVEEEREARSELIQLVNECTGARELMEKAVAFLQRRCGCEAASAWVQDDDDHPYTVGSACDTANHPLIDHISEVGTRRADRSLEAVLYPKWKFLDEQRCPIGRWSIK